MTEPGCRSLAFESELYVKDLCQAAHDNKVLPSNHVGNDSCLMSRILSSLHQEMCFTHVNSSELMRISYPLVQKEDGGTEEGLFFVVASDPAGAAVRL